jgi:glutaminyl-tRNA synthetase
MVVLRPLLLVIDNYPEDKVEELVAENNPEDPGMGCRKVPFSRLLYIEEEDFCEKPPKGYFRLAPGKEVRLKYAYYVRCERFVKDKTGKVVEIHCTYDPKTRGGWREGGQKVKGTLHWVSLKHAIPVEVRLYDRLFAVENPEEMEDFKKVVNKNSLLTLRGCKAEPFLGRAKPGDRYQFLRHGYFCCDKDSSSQSLVFNRIVPLRDTWAKIQKRQRESSDY